MSPTVRGRGLKRVVSSSLCPSRSVAHRTWAWIETPFLFSSPIVFSSSPTVRGRGLKRIPALLRASRNLSPTVRGRGLKRARSAGPDPA